MLSDVFEFGVTTRNMPAVRYGGWGMLVEETAVTSGTLVLSGSSAPWVIDAAKKLEALGKLPAGWDSYGGLPLDSTANKLTVSALGWLEDKNLPVPAVVLGSGGTVQLEWRARGKELEVELREDATIDFVKVHANGEIEEGNEKVNLPQRLRGLTWWFLHG